MNETFFHYLEYEHFLVYEASWLCQIICIKWVEGNLWP